MGSDYFTMMPQMKAPVDVAAAMGKYSSQMQVTEAGTVPARDELQVDDAPVHYQQKVNSYLYVFYLDADCINNMQFPCSN